MTATHVCDRIPNLPHPCCPECYRCGADEHARGCKLKETHRQIRIGSTARKAAILVALVGGVSCAPNIYDNPCVSNPSLCIPPPPPPPPTTTTTTTTLPAPVCAAPARGPWCGSQSAECFETVSARAELASWICGNGARSEPVAATRAFRVCTPGEICGCGHRPPGHEWEEFPACTGPVDPPPPPPPGGDAPKADDFRFDIQAEFREGSTAYFVTAVPLAGGKPVKPGQRLAAAGRVGWASTGCIAVDAPVVFKGWGGAAVDEANYLHVLNWISKKPTECTAIGKPKKVVRFTSCELNRAWRIDFPSQSIVGVPPGPCEFPKAQEPPPPPADGGVSWKQTEVGPDVCGVATPHLLEAVRAAQARVPLVVGEGEAGYHPRICADLRAAGLDCGWYGEELAVARDSSRSENFDLVLASGASRLAFYASTCTPATRSEAIGTDAAVDPTPTPAAGTWPQAVNAIRAKLHKVAGTSPRFPGMAMIDSVGLWNCRGLPVCTVGTLKRDYIPACGPEANEDDNDRKAEIVACAAKLAKDIGLRWEGGSNHPDNDWLHLVAPGARSRACTAAGVCSDWVTGQ